MNEFKVLSGTANSVERELNQFRLNHSVIISGMSATDETTTVIIELFPLPPND